MADFNGATQEGVGYYQVTQKDRRRWSTASAYLHPAVERNKNNVHVVTNAQVERIILDQNVAMGVRYRHKGQDEVARCSREIILAGGAVNSPQLLMLSGIGPADHLNSVGIRPLFDMPGVGGEPAGPSRRGDPAVLQDARHLRHGQQADVAVPEILEGQERPRDLADRRVGRLPVDSRPASRSPDLQLHVPAGAGGRSRFAPRSKKNGYSLHVCTLRPESTRHDHGWPRRIRWRIR